MINKKSIWFLTLFSLILVLSVYYITMPSELLLNTNGNYNETGNKPNTEVTESTVLVALRVESDEQLRLEMKELQDILTNNDTSIDQKNEAFNKMKDLNMKRGEEEALENKIKETYQFDSFVKIKNDNIEVVVKTEKHDNELANKIIRTVQENYDKQMYITVKFTK